MKKAEGGKGEALILSVGLNVDEENHIGGSTAVICNFISNASPSSRSGGGDRPPLSPALTSHADLDAKIALATRLQPANARRLATRFDFTSKNRGVVPEQPKRWLG